MANNYASIVNDLQRFKILEKDLSERVKEFIQRTDIDIDVRWNLFKYSKFGRTTILCDNEVPVINWNECTFYDDFYIYRYSTTSVFDFVEQVERNYLKKAEEGRDLFLEKALQEGLNEIKTYFLKEFLKEFIYDW